MSDAALFPTLVAMAAVLVSAVLHGISGTGFALVAVPAFVILYGAHDGIRIGLALGLMVSAFALVSTIRMVEWARALTLLAPALVLIPAGAWIVSRLDSRLLTLITGVLVIVLVLFALRVSATSDRGGSRYRWPIALAVGAGAALVHVTSALSAPLLAAHAIHISWPPKAFAATAQVTFIGYNILSLAFLQVDGGNLSTAGLLLLPLAAGLAIGMTVRFRLSDRVAIFVLSVVAMAGGVAAIIKVALI
ncbi:sulfite exporter TauE/SafE family protein [Ruicaihuangia caeni]|uniref:Probable membrane transporter protein n=1 Tax=Ruicaihuangia caeni TaxID=3042517 RepID=A0AAW6T4T0_9MICO|nr:sulfite exporter TauE/SafE family protein [Klugiella sp. YN-L-19]MDI2097378.1 sulfite exporter TauE/SafE family protein [Klugiella sp. YN-L-19]